MAAIVERRPTSQRERALAELELLLEGPAKDHDATLEHLRGITRACVEKESAKAGVTRAAAPACTSMEAAASPSPSPRPSRTSTAPIPSSRELFAGTDVRETLRRVRALREGRAALPGPGHTPTPTAPARDSYAKPPPDSETEEEDSSSAAASSGASAFGPNSDPEDEPPAGAPTHPAAPAPRSFVREAEALRDVRDAAAAARPRPSPRPSPRPAGRSFLKEDASGRDPPPSPPARWPLAPKGLSTDQAAALKRVFDRTVSTRDFDDPRAKAPARAVAASMEADSAVYAACGDRPTTLAAGFLRTLDDDKIDYATLCEIAAQSAQPRKP